MIYIFSTSLSPVTPYSHGRSGSHPWTFVTSELWMRSWWFPQYTNQNNQLWRFQCVLSSSIRLNLSNFNMFILDSCFYIRNIFYCLCVGSTIHFGPSSPSSWGWLEGHMVIKIKLISKHLSWFMILNVKVTCCLIACLHWDIKALRLGPLLSGNKGRMWTVLSHFVSQ